MTSTDALQALLEEVAARVADLVQERLAASVQAQAGQGADGWRLLTVDEAAEVLRRSSRWVRERARTGELPHVKIDGGALAFLSEDVEAFVRERRRPAEAGSLADRLQWPREPALGAGSVGARPVGNRRVAPGKDTGPGNGSGGPVKRGRLHG